MLTPDYLSNCTTEAVALYQSLDDDIIRDISRRIINTNFAITQSAAWQMEKLQQSGVLYQDAVSKIATITNQSEVTIDKIFQEGGTQTLKYDDSVYKKAGLNPLPLKQSPGMLQMLTAGVKNCNGELKNLSQTTAVTAQTAYVQAVDLAHMKIASGAFDSNTAIAQAIKQASSEGLSVLYPTGHTDKIDVAVRRSVLTSVSQTCGQVQMKRLQDMKCDLVETTAHGGARPSHAVWQGRVFSVSGDSSVYDNFEDSTGYGTGPGLMGWNCRHNFYPFYEGISQQTYSKDDLDKLANKMVKYDGKELKEYDAAQIQRGMERDIRAHKRTLIGLDEGIKGSKSTGAAQALKTEYNEVKGNLHKSEKQLREMAEARGMYVESARVKVAGYARGVREQTITRVVPKPPQIL